ncbi:MAG: VCBS domain-containing protein, partial [Gammaproteobacteria bacterium]
VDGTPSTVQITIDGTNDAATVSSASQALAETNAPVSTSGTLTSTDPDDPDNTFTPSSTTGTIGDFSIDAAGNWTFTANGAFDSLAVGDSVNETFNVTSVDGTPSTVQITITGTNDGPVITPIDVAGAITEGGTVSESGSITFADLDLGDTPTTTQALQSITTGLVLTPTQQAAIVNAFTISPDPGNTNDGTINWDYTIANSDLDFLANGDTITVVFRLTVDDGNGGTAYQDVVITIVGSNDAPVIGGVGSGSVSENVDVTSGNIVATGSLTISDPDTGESSFVAATVNGLYGNLVIDSAGNWRYSADNGLAEIQALVGGQTLIDTLTVTTADGSSYDVVITITGTDDASSSTGSSGIGTAGYVPPEDGVPTVQPPEIPDLAVVGGFQPPLFEEIESAPQDRGIEPEPGLSALDQSEPAAQPVEDVQYASVDDGERNRIEDKPAAKKAVQDPPLDVDNLGLQVSDDEAINERFEQALLKRLDAMNFGLEGEDGYRSADDIKVQILMGTTATLTAGIVSWVLRGGSLLASLMSTVPLLNRFDPLPILKNREEREDVEPDDDTEITGPVGEQHRRVDEMFSGKEET